MKPLSMTRARQSYPVVRRGFVLIAVAWVVSVATLGAAALAIDAAGDMQERSNRRSLLAVDYELAGCRSELAAALRRAHFDTSAQVTREMTWRQLDKRIMAFLPAGALSCAWEVRDAGERLDVTLLDAVQLRAALSNMGLSTASADSLVAALGDWTDGDGSMRPLGAEADWYRSEGMQPPTERQVGSAGELLDIRGWRGVIALGVFDVGSGPVSLLHAPPTVLTLLPGVSEELATLIRDTRESLGYVPDLLALARRTSRDSRLQLERELRALMRVAVNEPHAWSVSLVARVDGIERRMHVVFTRPSLLSGQHESRYSW
jgi:general secretion pathway protein K